MRLTENENSHIAVSDMLIDEINRKWDDVRDINSIIVTLKDEEEYKDIIPVIEQVLEDEHNNIGQIEQLVELIAPKATEIEAGKEETIDILDGEDIDLKMNENYSNAPEKFDTVIDNPTYAMANKEHDENEKKAEDALKANEKAANETIPKEGDTGKKITSPELKKMHLSEALFDEGYLPINDRLHDVKMMHEIMQSMNDEDAYYGEWIYTMPDEPDEVDFENFAEDDEEFEELKSEFDRIFNEYKKGGLYQPSEEAKQWLADNGYEADNLGESLNESTNEDEMEVRLMKYIKKFQNHYKINPNAMGKALQEIGKSLDILNTTNESLTENVEAEVTVGDDMIDYLTVTKDANGFTWSNYGGYAMDRDENPIYFDSEEAAIQNYLDLIHSENPGEEVVIKESLKTQVIKEQLDKYKNGKMPENWNPNTYLENLVKKNHISQEEADSLKESIN